MYYLDTLQLIYSILMDAYNFSYLAVTKKAAPNLCISAGESPRVELRPPVCTLKRQEPSRRPSRNCRLQNSREHICPQAGDAQPGAAVFNPCQPAKQQIILGLNLHIFEE